MIALVDWAYDKATENERIQAQDSASKVSLSDVASSVRKLDEDKRIMAAFEPRETSEPLKADLDENSPEYAIVDFLRCWKTRNYGKMAERSVNLSKHSITKMAGELRRGGRIGKAPGLRCSSGPANYSSKDQCDRVSKGKDADRKCRR